MKSIIITSLVFGLIPCNSHLIVDDHDDALYIGHENDFESINDKIFYDRVVGHNYTSETIFGEKVKYYITDDGYWHLDACSVIGHDSVGLMGTYRRLAEAKTDTDNHRRLNPYATNDWPGGDVYYTISHGSLNMDNFNEAISQYHAETPIRIYEADAARIASGTYINITDGSGCWSWIGMLSRSGDSYIGQELSLGGTCSNFLSTVMHEFGHALGLYHTQQRSDRNSYIRVLYENIHSYAHDNFEIKPAIPTCGEYNCDSMMHYTTTAFRNCTGSCVTMEAINPSQCTILRNSVNPLSEGDKVCLCELYEPGVNGNPSYCATPSPTKVTSSPTDMPTKLTVSPTKTTSVPSLSPTITGAPPPAPSTNGFCLSGTAGATQTSLARYITGFWEEKTSGSTTYYQVNRNFCQEDRYIIWSGSVWGIALTSSYTPSTGFYATCPESNVYNCDGKWTVFTESSANTGIKLTTGACKVPSAATITISGTSSSCDTTFTQLTDPYTYESSNNYQIKYNDLYEYWICYFNTIETTIATFFDQCYTFTSTGESEYGITPIETGQTISYGWTKSGAIGTASFQGQSSAPAKIDVKQIQTDTHTGITTYYGFSLIQWAIVAGIIVTIILINIIVSYCVVRKIKKRLLKSNQLRQSHNNGIQKNIQIVPFNNIDSSNINTDGSNVTTTTQ